MDAAHLLHEQKSAKKDSIKKLSGLPRNVNLYSHFFVHSYITEQDINWVLKLRKKEDRTARLGMKAVPPSVYGKNTQIYHNHIQKNNQARFLGTTSSIEHLVYRRIGTKPSHGQLVFQSSLRNSLNKTKLEREGEALWRSYACRDRYFPTMLASPSKKLDMNLSSDGSNGFLKYTEKIVRRRNIGEVDHIARSTDLPTLGFQASLRLDLSKSKRKGEPLAKTN